METGSKSIVTTVTVMMRAEISSFNDGTIRGELHSQYLEAPCVFFDVIYMIEKMEEIFDSKGFPMMFLKPRAFSDSRQAVRKNKTVKNYAMKDIIDIKATEGLEVAKCTFEIAVRFRQNATWQGQIIWAEKNLKQNFRSVLEMLRLMDEALMEEVDDENLVGWKGRRA
ncbi:MAG: hypothetical protein FWH57_02860 [Oscillospiraceae bacterium]|nr:hypothetical protein [Oscillospiraceae bacterium]